MKTMKWLLRREFWEHKGAMLWAPLVAGALILSVQIATLAYMLTKPAFKGKLTVHGQATDIKRSLAGIIEAKKDPVVESIASMYLAASAPLFLMLAAVVFFYCLSALHDERRDRSILFWKSLPVSDAQTVASKVLTAVLVAPLITLGIAVFMSVLAVLLAGILFAFQGVNLIGPLLSHPAFYLSPLQVLGLLPVYALWALPTVGWLLLVSAWVKSKVFLCAVGVPVLTIIVIKWIDYLLGAGFDVQWFVQNVLVRGLLGLVPGVWLLIEQVDPNTLVLGTNRTVAMSGVFAQSWMTLTGASVWVGAALGAAMIYAASRLRRWKDEG